MQETTFFFKKFNSEQKQKIHEEWNTVNRTLEMVVKYNALVMPRTTQEHRLN